MEQFNTYLSLRDATENEIKQALSDPNAIIIEWATGVTFIASQKELCLVRTGIMGGDVREVHWGWIYLTPMHLMKELGEIRQVAFGMRTTSN